MRTKLLSSLIALALSGPAVFGQISDTQLVDNAYPPELEASRDPDSSRFSTFAAADLNRNGQTLLIALYTNGTQAAISVLDPGGRVLSHPDFRYLKGFRGELQLVDLDGDGVPEIIAQLTAGHGYGIPDSWVFAWRNGQLALISPTATASKLPVSLLSQIAAVDLDGSGKLSLLAFPGVQRDDNGNVVANGDVAVYSLSNGQLTHMTTAFSYAQAFYRRTTGPTKAVKTFSSPAGARKLRIINGIAPNGSAVDSARVTLNGTEVVHPANFKPKAHVIDVPVQLGLENRLEVELTGKPGSGIWVAIVAP